jgi:hypothetical protein
MSDQVKSMYSSTDNANMWTPMASTVAMPSASWKNVTALALALGPNALVVTNNPHRVEAARRTKATIPDPLISIQFMTRPLS